MFAQIRKTQFTCDYIGSIVLNLIGKLVSEETQTSTVVNIDRGCVTVQCFRFAIDTYCTIGQNTAFRPVNREILQRRLLTIIYVSFYNAHAKNTNNMLNEYLDLHGQFKCILKMLSTESEHDLFGWSDEVVQIKREHISAAAHFLLLIVQRFVSLHADETARNIYKRFFEILQSNQHILIDTFQKFVVHNTGGILCKTLKLLLKLIQNIRTSTEGNKSRGRRAYHSRDGCPQHHHNAHELGCVLEKCLLSLAETVLKSEQLQMIFRFLHKNQICCCNIDLLNIERLLFNSKKLRCQKNCLNFIKNNVLKTIFSNNECSVCDERKITFDKDDSFVRLYKNWLSKLQGNDIIIFLEHVAKISKYLPFDIQFKIFVDVVLPTFRAEKLQLEETNGDGCCSQPHRNSSSSSSSSKEIIMHCLNIFLCYLHDIRIIKGFFNDENVQYMEDLIVVPEFASLICCLLKIGLDNASFLGENCGEQLVLSEKLRTLKTNSIQMITEVLMKLFTNIAHTYHIKHLNVLTELHSDIGKNRIMQLLEAGKLTIQNILHLATIYWNMLLQVMRSNDIKSNQQQQILSDSERKALIVIVHNSLSCFLYTEKVTERPNLGESSIALNRDEYDDKLSTWLLQKHLDNDHLDIEEANDSYTPTGIFDFQNTNKNFTQITENAIFEPECNAMNEKENSFSFIYELKCDQTKIPESDSTTIINDVINKNQRSYEEPLSSSYYSALVNSSTSVSSTVASNDSSSRHSNVQSFFQFISDTLFASVTYYKSTEPSANKDKKIIDDGNDAADIIDTHLFSKVELNQVKSVIYKTLLMQLFEVTCGVMMCTDLGRMMQKNCEYIFGFNLSII